MRTRRRRHKPHLRCRYFDIQHHPNHLETTSMLQCSLQTDADNDLFDTQYMTKDDGYNPKPHEHPATHSGKMQHLWTNLHQIRALIESVIGRSARKVSETK